MRKFVDEQLQPNDLVAIIRTGGEVGSLQQFTTDKRLLYSALEHLKWNHCSRTGVYVFAPAGRWFDPGAGPCGGHIINATLSIMVGGKEDVFERCRSVLEAFGKTLVYCGPSGSGQVGFWGGQSFTTRAAWFYELGLDAHSVSGDPLFVNPLGADGQLGYTGGVER